MKKLNEKKLFLFDIDGTLAVEEELFDGSRELLSYIESVGGRSYFITNNSTRSGQDYVKRFRDCFRLETLPEQFITSGYMTLRFLKEHYGNSAGGESATGKIFVLGTASFLKELRAKGLAVTEEVTEDICCAVAAYDSELSYGKLVNICRLLSTTRVPFYATNPDLCCPAGFGFIPDCGAICNMIIDSTGRTPTYLGKPNKEVVELCLSASGFTKEETLVVGDRLYTDIACGMNAGVDTCLLFTGEAKQEDLINSPYKPSFTFDTVRELYQNICR